MKRHFLSENIGRLALFISGVLISAIASGLIEAAINWSEATLIITVIVVAISVVFLAMDSRNSIQTLADKIQAEPLIRSFSEQADMYREITKYVETNGVETAILIQYSSVAATNLLRKLASQGADITLYMIKSDYAVGDIQIDRVSTGLKQLPGVLQVSRNYKLTAYEYEAPASIRAVKIDDTLIGIGWYTYEHVSTIDNNYPRDSIEISGHDVPGLLLSRGSHEYEVIDKMIRKQITNFQEFAKCNSKKPILELP